MSIRTAIVRRADRCRRAARRSSEHGERGDGRLPGPGTRGERRTRRDGHRIQRVWRRWPSESWRAIADECAATFGITHLVAEHRLGELALGDASIAIVVAHPHRAAAYEASRFVIEEVKRRLPVWKREGYVDGTSEWVNAGGVSQGAAAPEQR